MLTIAKCRLEPLELPWLDGHHQDEAHRGGEQRGEQEVGDGPERDHSRHLRQRWMKKFDNNNGLRLLDQQIV